LISKTSHNIFWDISRNTSIRNGKQIRCNITTSLYLL